MSVEISPEAPAPKAAQKPRVAPKTTKTASAVSPFPEFEAFVMPKIEVPAVVREMTEKGIEQARDAYAKVKNAAEEATDLLEDTFETSRQGVVEFNLKAIDAAKANTDATFSFFKDLMAVKTVAEAIELQSTFARQQFDALTAQAKDMQEFATKLTSDVTSPVKDAVEKSFKDLKAA
ncbi:phasin [Microvirga tunisiensis]|uniref:Phasin n=1 Tax=Pannonibacter tanglangensis TaxID=2750084 RepID=A0A7X5J912_9HYPH|nr:phasin [Pannonibacter sp. XCT-53]NBN79067.1 phasin [Pannonibacter sp. XCT-53]